MNRLLRIVVPPIVGIVLVASLGVEIASGDPDARIAWLDEQAAPLATCEAGHGFADLAPVGAMIGDARIVGLGESTHGTREHFQMKHRLVEYLVVELGFTWFAIEASTPEAHRLDAYVLGGEGDPAALIGGMYYWTWNTEEVLAMVEWMRAHNARSDRKVHFTGFDMQTPDVAADEVVEFLEAVSSPLAARAAAEYPRIVTAPRGGSAAITTYAFPVVEARGKTVRFSGWIKTENLQDGYAGLWWRVDGPDGEVLAFDNMAYRGPSGTTDWTEYAIELPVASEAVNINFGFLMTGQGTAWIDAADIELDGAAYDATSFDLGFEGAGIAAHYHTDDDAYTSRLDGTVARAGRQSLRLASVPGQPDGPAAAEAAILAEAILTEMQAARDEWLGLRPAEEVERALLNARIVVQCMQMRAGPQGGIVRDASMAENVVWLAEQYPDARLVLWAHNGHVSRASGAMGQHLADRFGEDYVPVAFATARGRYSAVGDGGLGSHELQAPPDDSFEAIFAASEVPLFALDLRSGEPGNEESGWLCETRLFRSIGARAMDRQFYPTPLRSNYDLLIFVEETTPARQLASRPGPRD
jgi:erythromycin esterase-like protein